MEENAALELRGPRYAQKAAHYLSHDEIAKLLAAPDRNRPRGRRDSAILHVLYSAGLRVSEAVGLNLADVNTEQRLLTIRRTKAKRDRFAFLGPPAVKALSAWLDVRGEMARDSSPFPVAVFVNRDGERLSIRSIGRIFRGYAEAVGLPRHYTPHSLRHTFATHLLANGADLPAIKELLGHTNLLTTCHYADLSQVDLKKVLRERHPRP